TGMALRSICANQVKNWGGAGSAIQVRRACSYKDAPVALIDPHDLISEDIVVSTRRIPYFLDSTICDAILFDRAVPSRRQDQPDRVEPHEPFFRADPINHLVRREVLESLHIVDVFCALHRGAKQSVYLLWAAPDQRMSAQQGWKHAFAHRFVGV